MSKGTYVIVRGQYEFTHCYPEAPDEVSYLRDLHRHLFNYEVEIEVYHDDRELEFIMVKHVLEDFLATRYTLWSTRTSCEQMADSIADCLQSKYGFLRYLSVKVFEDNENGAKIIR